MWSWPYCPVPQKTYMQIPIHFHLCSALYATFQGCDANASMHMASETLTEFPWLAVQGSAMGSTVQFKKTIQDHRTAESSCTV
jgi:hypothetical protein